ncbi:MAG: polyphosphate kinase 1 [Baileyella intestinalis]|uniref:polyphosphate kinase 1 n=1 Tax=Baileyella intestinalis TaxID=2606709 RepID=UPI002A7487BD|nr:polyphosphate kinase 1 [Baileyella intestinalis]MCI7685221.1 polyphosphate kinase 1 [Clostridiales bacterium]MDY2995123.1 polyphosphate kinase 1 [Baileyella intestinalis]
MSEINAPEIDCTPSEEKVPGSKIPEAKGHKCKYTQNREISWLRFNMRVLDEACDPAVPLMERVKFFSIFSSNLDEFFMVRVGSLVDMAQLSPHERDNKTGMNAGEQLDLIYETVHRMMPAKYSRYEKLCRELDDWGISRISFAGLTNTDMIFVRNYFLQHILPAASSGILEDGSDTLEFKSKDLYVASRLEKNGHHSTGVIKLPDNIERFVRLPGEGIRYILTEDILCGMTQVIFKKYKVLESCILSVTRNADLSFDDEKFDDSDDDFLEKFSRLLHKRNMLSVVRLEVSWPVSSQMIAQLKKTFDIIDTQIFIEKCPIKPDYASALIRLLPAQDRNTLLYRPYDPVWPSDISTSKSMVEQIMEKDRLLFFPFDSVDPFLNLLVEACNRTDVFSIKITIYRLANPSRIASILCRAAENGKDVTVLMELRARFDEANNISWAKKMEQSGCKVFYGLEKYKCHSKLCLISMNTEGEIHYITQIGTGNYNEVTNRLYTDLSLMTASREIGKDADDFFRNIMESRINGTYSRLLVSPLGIKSSLISMINEQARLGKEGYICIKANSVTERGIIDALAEASMAGVEIRLIIRGICCLLPEVPGYTDNIHVTSIVGRYLEHGRIYCFGRGENAKLFISSADLMTRNLNRRVEVACPVTDPYIRKELLTILDTQLRDNVKARTMRKDGTYEKKALLPSTTLQGASINAARSSGTSNSGSICSSQDEFMVKSIHNESDSPETDNYFSKLWS